MLDYIRMLQKEEKIIGELMKRREGRRDQVDFCKFLFRNDYRERLDGLRTVPIMHCCENEMPLHLETFPDGRCKIMSKNCIQMDGIVQVDEVKVCQN